MLEAVAEHVMATYVSAKADIVEAASADGIDPLVDLRSGWVAQIAFGLANPTLFRLMSDPSRVVDSPAARSGRDVLASRVRRVAAAGRLRVSEDRAIGLIQAAGIGSIQLLLATAPDERDAGLADSIYEAVLAQILTDTPARDDGSLATAIAFRTQVSTLDVLSDAERLVMAEWLDRAIAAG